MRDNRSASTLWTPGICFTMSARYTPSAISRAISRIMAFIAGIGDLHAASAPRAAIESDTVTMVYLRSSHCGNHRLMAMSTAIVSTICWHLLEPDVNPSTFMSDWVTAS